MASRVFVLVLEAGHYAVFGAVFSLCGERKNIVYGHVTRFSALEVAFSAGISQKIIKI